MNQNRDREGAATGRSCSLTVAVLIHFSYTAATGAKVLPSRVFTVVAP
jgi:hypothetical protein